MVESWRWFGERNAIWTHISDRKGSPRSSFSKLHHSFFAFLWNCLIFFKETAKILRSYECPTLNQFMSPNYGTWSGFDRFFQVYPQLVPAKKVKKIQKYILKNIYGLVFLQGLLSNITRCKSRFSFWYASSRLFKTVFLRFPLTKIYEKVRRKWLLPPEFQGVY